MGNRLPLYRRAGPAALLALTLSLGSPKSAIADDGMTVTKSLYGEAQFRSIDPSGCYLSLGFLGVATRSGHDGETEADLVVMQRDICQDRWLNYASGRQVVTDGGFQIDNGLTGAHLVTTITLEDGLSGAELTAPVDVTWAPVPESSRATGGTVELVGHQLVFHDHTNETTQSAIASGTVIVNGLNVAGRPSAMADIGMVKDGQFALARVDLAAQVMGYSIDSPDAASLAAGEEQTGAVTQDQASAMYYQLDPSHCVETQTFLYGRKSTGSHGTGGASAGVFVTRINVCDKGGKGFYTLSGTTPLGSGEFDLDPTLSSATLTTTLTLWDLNGHPTTASLDLSWAQNGPLTRVIDHQNGELTWSNDALIYQYSSNIASTAAATTGTLTVGNESFDVTAPASALMMHSVNEFHNKQLEN